MYVTGVTFLMDNTSEDQYIRSYVYQVLCMSLVIHCVTGVTFLMNNTSEDQYIRSYVTGVTVTGVTFLMNNTSEDQYIRSYECHWCYCHWCYLPYG